MAIDINGLPTWVYRCECQHEGLLYVGVAVDLERRIAQHVATKDWWCDVAFIDTELYDTRAIALKVEAQYIEHENPKFNVRGKAEIPDPPYDLIRGRRHYLNLTEGVRLQSGQGAWR